MKKYLIPILVVLIGLWGYQAIQAGPVALQPALTTDKDVGGVVTITTPHQTIHRGNSFKLHYSVTTAPTDDHRTGVFLKTPTDKEIHMVASFSVSAAGEFFICEAITIDVNEGTNAVVPLNRNRNSATTSTIYDNATTPAVGKYGTWTETQLGNGNFSCGTELAYEPLVLGQGPKPSGGSSRDSQEKILKQNTKYLFYTQNIGAAANVHHIWLNWYEVD